MSFTAWLRNRKIPDADQITVLIQAAGAAGIPEGELRSSVDLPRIIVDELLATLVGAGQVKTTMRDP
jgi:hypothetical protein